MNVHRAAAVASSVVVAAAIAVGLYVGGTPDAQRAARLDERRIEHLRLLSDVIRRRHEQEAALPASLADLVDGRLISRLPTDPVSGEPYDYVRLDAGAFRLCVVFDGADRSAGEAEPAAPDFWDHPAGPACFEFTLTEREAR